MTAEALSALERLEAMAQQALDRLAALEARLSRWEAILPDPESLRGKVAKRRLARTAAEMLEEGGA